MATPRKKKPKPLDNAQRVAAFRERMEAEGGKQIAINLSPTAVAKLDAERAKTGETMTQIINRLLSRLRHPV